MDKVTQVEMATVVKMITIGKAKTGNMDKMARLAMETKMVQMERMGMLLVDGIDKVDSPLLVADIDKVGSPILAVGMDKVSSLVLVAVMDKVASPILVVAIDKRAVWTRCAIWTK